MIDFDIGKLEENMVTQDNDTTFDFDEFLSRSGPILWEYLPAQTRLTIPAPMVQQIIDHLDSFDKEHLIYALEISCDFEGEAFAPLIPQYLVHPSKSVRLTALRKLHNLDHVSKEVYELVKKFAPQCREREIVKEILELVSKKVI